MRTILLKLNIEDLIGFLLVFSLQFSPAYFCLPHKSCSHICTGLLSLSLNVYHIDQILYYLFLVGQICEKIVHFMIKA